MRGFVTRTCFKHGPPHSTGIEAEWFVVDDTAAADTVPIDRLRSLLAPVQPLPAGSLISFEPGGQLELSTAVSLDGAAGAIQRLTADLAAVRSALAPAGLRLLATGTDPLRRPDRQLDLPRYRAMQAFYDRRGLAGAAMMTSSAALQVCLGAGTSDADLHRRWHTANALAPVLVAMFANSPLRDGRPTGWASTRQSWWQEIGSSRPAGEDPVEAYTRYALAAPVMVVRDDGCWVADPGMSFAGWLAGGYPRRPTQDDLAYHLSTLFPPVRAHGWLEIRVIDAIGDRWWPVAVALTSALVTDPVAADAARDACLPVAGQEVRAARLGLADPAVRRAAAGCVEAALRSVDGEPSGGLERYAERYLDTARSPADDVLDAYRAGHDPWTATTFATLQEEPA